MQRTLHQNCDPESQFHSSTTVSGCREHGPSSICGTHQDTANISAFCTESTLLIQRGASGVSFFSSLFLHSAFSTYVHIQCD